MSVYDVAVVGAGMVGASAARHLTLLRPGLKLCLVGPEEPQDKASQAILGCYYDEGRLCRQLYTHPGWAGIAKRAAASYREIMDASGIRFFEEMGCITISNKGSDYQQRMESVASQVGISFERLSHENFKKEFPYIHYSQLDEAWLERRGAGRLNPRLFVKAEMKLAVEGGCQVIRDVVAKVDRGKDGLMEVRMENKGTILARKVLLATGAFTAFRELLPGGLRPDVNLLTNTVLLAQVSEEDQVKMRNMPSMMYNGSGIEIDGKNYFYTYILPPIKYPDGNVYLKLGHMDLEGIYDLCSEEKEVHEFFKGPGNPKAIRLLLKVMNRIFPDLHPLSLRTDTCTTTHTRSGTAFIDLLHPQLGIAIGGNGTAGKSADELGKMAASLLLNGTWSSPEPQHWFKFQARAENGPGWKLGYAKV